MAGYTDPMAQSADEQAPYEGGAAPQKPQRLAGTISQSPAVGLKVGAFATLQNAAAPVRVRFGASAPTATVTDPYLAAGDRIRWYVTQETAFPAVIHADGVTAFEAHVWTSSGPRVG